MLKKTSSWARWDCLWECFHIYLGLNIKSLINFKVFSCKSFTVGVASVAKIPNNRMTSSTKFNASTPAFNSRLGFNAGSSWCSATSDSSPYLQIDLGAPYVICGIATQGDHMSIQWVQTYQIQTSRDGASFTYYKQNSISKVMRADWLNLFSFIDVYHV